MSGFTTSWKTDLQVDKELRWYRHVQVDCRDKCAVIPVSVLCVLPFFSPPVNCSEPTTPGNGFIEPYQNTTAGAEISFSCNSGFVPSATMMATCGADGRWNPDPATHTCTCECPPMVYTLAYAYLSVCVPSLWHAIPLLWCICSPWSTTIHGLFLSYGALWCLIMALAYKHQAVKEVPVHILKWSNFSWLWSTCCPTEWITGELH